MWIVNGQAHSKFNIPHSKQFFPLSSIGWFLLSLFPIGRDLQFSLRIRIAENMPTCRFMYYPHHEGAKRSPIRIHDVEGKSVVNYPHHECAEFIAKCFHEENSMALPTS
jgi:hypothetical protein